MSPNLLWWLTINLLAGMAACVTIGRWFRRTPRERLEVETTWLALRTFESGGGWYEERLAIKTWKDRLPETGGRFGGISKRALPSRDDAGLRTFLVECRRGEVTHWALVAASPMFLLWNTPVAGALLTTLGAMVNLPFILVLRYNRARIESIIHRAEFSRPRSDAP